MDLTKPVLVPFVTHLVAVLRHTRYLCLKIEDPDLVHQPAKSGISRRLRTPVCGLLVSVLVSQGVAWHGKQIFLPNPNLGTCSHSTSEILIPFLYLRKTSKLICSRNAKLIGKLLISMSESADSGCVNGQRAVVSTVCYLGSPLFKELIGEFLKSFMRVKWDDTTPCAAFKTWLITVKYSSDSRTSGLKRHAAKSGKSARFLFIEWKRTLNVLMCGRQNSSYVQDLRHYAVVEGESLD